MSGDADKAWDQMLGKSGSTRPQPPSTETLPTPTPSRPSSPAAPSPAALPLASAAKWGAVLVLGVVAIVAVAWVVISNRTRPAIVNAPPPTPVAPDSGASTPAPPSQTPTTTSGSLLDINTATAAQLEHLPGVGPAIAQRIVDDRSRHGRYSSIDELDRVQGIGKKTIEKLRPYLMVK